MENKIFENGKKITKNIASSVVPFTKEKFNDVKEFTNDKAIPVIKQTATNTKDNVVNIANKTTDKIKSNITEEQMLEILDNIYIKSVNGIPKVSVPIDDLVDDYTKKNSNIL